ncbi:MAG: pilus assembly protein [Bdellovibrionaceae bacterium]|nr:pilus assembly protein [Pseudobdellovibrionaceae bacterium]
MKQVLILASLIAMNSISNAASIVSIVLNIGETYQIARPANDRIWVENRKPLEINSKNGSITLAGKAEGSTVVQVGNTSYRFEVVIPTKKNLMRQFENKLEKILGLKVKIIRQQVTITGKLFSWDDWMALADISKNLDIPYNMSAEIPTSIKKVVNQHLTEVIEQAGLPPISIEFSRPLQARLSVIDAQFEKYKRILSPFGIHLEKDVDAINIAPVVKVEITVAEIRRDLKQTYGVQWPQSYSATLLPDGQRQFEQLIFTANALENQGQGRILASPSLLCRSGKEAEFLAGGEFPIKIMNLKMQDVIWKKYGVQLKVRPKADTSGRMSIGLDVEVSTIDDSRTVDGVPGLLTNKISSQFDLAKSQTIALSGLIKNETGRSSQGLPLLGRIPILGSLFSSKDFRENRTELVIFVRPSVIKESQNDLPRMGHLGEVPND